MARRRRQIKRKRERKKKKGEGKSPSIREVIYDPLNLLIYEEKRKERKLASPPKRR